MKYHELFSMEPEALILWLVKEFDMELPTEIITTEDMENAAKLMMKLTSQYSYLCTILSYAKVKTREAKRSGDKKAYEDMVDRREVIQHFTDCVKQKYAAISRAVTIHIENNAELRMNASGYVRGKE